jgi:hypothetical protein
MSKYLIAAIDDNSDKVVWQLIRKHRVMKSDLINAILRQCELPFVQDLIEADLKRMRGQENEKYQNAN